MYASFEVLPGLPATGAYPEQFSADGRGTHREGLVVRVSPASGTPWIGNFQCGLTNFSAALAHPDGTSVLVIAGGNGYVVDPDSRALRSVLAGVYAGAWPWPPGPLVLLDHSGVWFEALGPEGSRWTSRRISWDGFRHVSIAGQRAVGEAWSPVEDAWIPFEIDLRTGEAVGGAYPDGTLS